MKFEQFLSLLLVPFACLTLIILLRRRQRQPPGPPGIPFIGNFLQFDFSAPHIYLCQLAKKYGPIMSMKFGSVPILIISSPDLAKEVLKTQDLVFCSRPRLLGQQRLSYNNSDMAFSPYGEQWRELRKITILHLLSNKQVQSFDHIREEETYEMMKKISSIAERGDAANLSSIVMSFTSTLICRIAFGRRSDENTPYKTKFDELMHESQAMLGGFFVSDYMPWLGCIDKLSGMIDRLERVYKEFDEFYQELIDSHMDPKRCESLNYDILGLLIQLKRDQPCAIDITWEHIKGLLMNTVVAATDTSASAVIWAMATLMRNSKAMNKLRRELRDTIKEQSKVTQDDITKLPYLKAVVKEILRLYPPAPLLVPREAQNDCLIRGYEVKSKTMVYINAWAIARDSEYWECPEEFIPERFLNGKVDVVGQHFEVIPFGAGRRICPGISMGLATVELALANLVYAFDWELPHDMKSEDIDFEATIGITVHKKTPLCLVPKIFK